MCVLLGTVPLAIGSFLLPQILNLRLQRVVQQLLLRTRPIHMSNQCFIDDTMVLGGGGAGVNAVGGRICGF
jgi:hypothetical protein